MLLLNAEEAFEPPPHGLDGEAATSSLPASLSHEAEALAPRDGTQGAHAPRPPPRPPLPPRAPSLVSELKARLAVGGGAAEAHSVGNGHISGHGNGNGGSQHGRGGRGHAGQGDGAGAGEAMEEGEGLPFELKALEVSEPLGCGQARARCSSSPSLAFLAPLFRIVFSRPAAPPGRTTAPPPPSPHTHFPVPLSSACESRRHNFLCASSQKVCLEVVCAGLERAYAELDREAGPTLEALTVKARDDGANSKQRLCMHTPFGSWVAWRMHGGGCVRLGGEYCAADALPPPLSTDRSTPTYPFAEI